MAESRGCLGRALLVLAVACIGLLAAVVLLAYLVGSAVGTLLSGPAPLAFDPLTGLVEVATPAQPNSLAWSPDGEYLAGGTWGSPPQTGAIDPTGEVYVVSVRQTSVVTTLKQTAWVRGVAFSPNGNWLAVATANTLPGETAELVVYDVPAFTPQFRARGGQVGGFVDLAWALDSQTLWALDSPDVPNQQARLRRWAGPGFIEQPAIHEPQTHRYEALAVAPHNRTVAALDTTGAGGTRILRLFDPATGKERSSFQAGATRGIPPRLGFTPDGKTLGVDDLTAGLTWWDAATGKAVEPDLPRFAAPLSGLSYFPSHHAVSPDGTRRVEGYKKQARLVFEGVGGPANQFGVLVQMTASGKSWTWRLGEEYGLEPAVAFSPDGTRLAATLGKSGGSSIMLWTVPKT